MNVPVDLDPTTVAALRDRLDARGTDMVDELRTLVEHETPTGDLDRLDALAAVLTRQWEGIGATVTHHDVAGTGTHLVATWPGPSGTPAAAPVLLVGHYDTVHDVGTLQRNPWRVDDGGRAWGPGTQDMKSGLVIARHALAALGDLGRPLARPVTAVITADEEIGSPTSRDLIRELGGDSACALVFEAARSDGALKVERKGVGLWTLQVRGHATHAGQHFFDGVSANVALAELILDIAALSDRDAGTTVNVGTIAGGTRANVVAERARAAIDVRFTTDAEAGRVGAALAGLRSRLDVDITLEGGVNRPAMRRSPASDALFARARAAASAVGFTVEASAAGGASDGNFLAADGLATLDGMGGVGAGLHTDTEWVAVGSLPQRAAMLAVLLAGDDG